MISLLVLLSLQGPAPREVAIEQRLARELGLEVGDTVRVHREPGAVGTLMVVSAIYQARSDPATVLRNEFEARLHLADLARPLGAPDRIDRAGIRRQPGNAPETAAHPPHHGPLG